MGMSVRVISNRLPQVARALGVDTTEAVLKAAQFTRDEWSRDVRVSAGPGNYEDSHYRDNIGVMREGLNSFVIMTPVPYAIFNEFGSATISAKPSAKKAADKGFIYLEKLLREAIEKASGG